MVGNHIEDPSTGEGDNKTITGANTKATVENLIPPTEAIIIMTIAIIEVEVVTARAEIIHLQRQIYSLVTKSYWCLHDPVTTKSYQISTDMGIEIMPHAMYFSGNTHTITKINHVPYQTIQYDDKGMFPAQLMDNTPIQVFIDNGATPSIPPFSTYNKHPILQKYLRTRSTTPIHTEGGTI